MSQTLDVDDRGLSIDMLDVDRLRDWARNILTHGHDISEWGSVPFVAGKMQIMATEMEKAIRDIGELRAEVERLRAAHVPAPQGEQEWLCHCDNWYTADRVLCELCGKTRYQATRYRPASAPLPAPQRILGHAHCPNYPGVVCPPRCKGANECAAVQDPSIIIIERVAPLSASTADVRPNPERLFND